jgi:dTDP-4-dehydrorhamnose 3,5-epimerase
MLMAHEITEEWLHRLDFQVQPVAKAPTISNVIIRDLKVNLDGRGEVTELWSKPWMEEGLIQSDHIYQSATDCGVVKCWHLHQVHTDQFVVTRGKLQVTLVDLREDSPTFKHVNAVFLGSLRPRLIKIPPMIMHGWKALSPPEVIVVNFQSHVFDKGDEFRFPWDCVLKDIWEPKNG